MNLVYEFLEKIKLKITDKIVIGVSSGPDSMCLLNILVEIRKKNNFDIIVVYINHKLRIESDEEEHFLELYCKNNNLKFEKTSINSYPKSNIEAYARKFRYEFYEKIIKKYHANYLMTAHHGDDLIETILMRLVRGSNLRGYQGISLLTIKNNYFIVRPLLYVTKEQILAYLKENFIPYCIDKSNFSLDYTRNRYRLNVLPFLKKENKNVHLKFLQFENKLEECNNYIEKKVIVAYNNCCINRKIIIQEFLKLDSFLQTLGIEKILKELYSDLSIINDKHIELLLNLIRNWKTGKQISLPNKIIAIIEYNYLVLKNIDKQVTQNYCFELVDGLTIENGMKFYITNTLEKGNDILRINSQDVKLPLYVRNRQNGDYIELKGSGKKKVKDIFIDMKINKSVRNSYPIVVDSNNEVIWIPKLKKSKYDVKNNEKYDIIFRCL